MPNHNRVVVLAGNPNCGKTTLFNGLTGLNQRIGNWPGVTVEKKEGNLTLRNGEDITVVDLPGIYSLTAASLDEVVSRDFLIKTPIDLIINVIDASNLERSLFFTTQLLELGIPMMILVNMMDLAEKNGLTIHTDHLALHLKLPVISISALKKADVDILCETLTLNNFKATEVRVSYPTPIEQTVTDWAPFCQLENIPGRWGALKLLERDSHLTDKIIQVNKIKKNNFEISQIENTIIEIEKKLKTSLDIALADSRYAFIHGLSRDILVRKPAKESFTDILDRWVLGRWTGIPTFIIVMYGVFWVTITFGSIFVDFFDKFFGILVVKNFNAFLYTLGTPDSLRVLLAYGIGSGIQTVSTFIPIIFLMFLTLALLEDSGYMARAAFLMDRTMRRLGLPGKSFVPLLVGFGCSLPAIMSTRTLETNKDRFMTIFITPFMSCGARLPVYALFGAAIFGVWAGTIVFSLYLVGILVAVLTGILLKKTLFQGNTSHFIMELPAYHAPRFGHTFLEAWNRLKAFIIKAGVVIILMVTILSTLNSIYLTPKGLSFQKDTSEHSLMAETGKSVTQILVPLGLHKDDWQITVSLFSGLFAKESIIGSLNSLNRQSQVNETVDDSNNKMDWTGVFSESFQVLGNGFSNLFSSFADPMHIKSAISETSNKDQLETLKLIQNYFSPYSGYAILLFILLYFPCIATYSTAIKEMGLQLATLMVVYNTLVAWIMATLFYQFTAGHQVIWILVSLVLILTIIFCYFLLGKSKRIRKGINYGFKRR